MVTKKATKVGYKRELKFVTKEVTNASAINIIGNLRSWAP